MSWPIMARRNPAPPTTISVYCNATLAQSPPRTPWHSKLRPGASPQTPWSWRKITSIATERAAQLDKTKQVAQVPNSERRRLADGRTTPDCLVRRGRAEYSLPAPKQREYAGAIADQRAHSRQRRSADRERRRVTDRRRVARDCWGPGHRACCGFLDGWTARRQATVGGAKIRRTCADT